MKLNSSYWKVNNDEPLNNNGSYFLPANTSFSKTGSTVAVGSNTDSENLKIFQLEQSSLIHLTSITLPDIQSLKFLTPANNGIDEFKFLATGHSNGIAYLSTIPVSNDSPFQNAEIIKRFNHSKNLKGHHGASLLNNGKSATAITSIGLSPTEWNSTPMNSLMTIYDNHVFLWDSCRSRAPKSVISTSGVTSLAPNPKMDGVIGIVGDFGVSLLDFKVGNVTIDFGKKSSLYVPNNKYATTAPISIASNTPKNGKRQFSSPSSSATSINFNKSKPTGATNISWHSNGNYLATSAISNRGDVVQIWDVRKLEPLAELEGSRDEIMDMKWIDNTLWTADKDGSISKWNSKSITGGSEDTYGSPSKQTENFKVSNSSIIGLELIDEAKEGVLCLDTKFLSLHNDASDAFKRPEHIDTSYANSVFSSLGCSDSPDSPTSQSNFGTDYSLQLQKDIDRMLGSLNYIVRDNTIYL